MGQHEKHMLGAVLSDKGVDFCVWAPNAASVSVLVGEPFDWQETSLERDDNNRWSGFAEGVQAGQSYKYKITTHEGAVIEKNDPRARQLTASDEGVSVIIDPHYDWEGIESPVIEKNEHIIYELHIGTFHRPDAATTGTFASATEKLDYLQQLGVTTIELMPVTSIAMSNGWGYAPNYLFSVENSYGGRRGLLDFVKEAHRRGMAVILDVVYNHFFPATDLWQFDGWQENNRGGIYFYNDDRGDTPWGGRPDYGRKEVREFILDNVAMWLTEYRIDGLRVDSTIYMRNTKGPEGDESTAIPEAWSLLQEITQLAHRINDHSLMVAEDSSVNNAITAPVEAGGAGFDAQWGLTFPHTVRAALGLEVEPYGNTLSGEMAHFYNGAAFQKVVFSDSHDTAANGSVRLNEAVAPGNAATTLARQHTLLASLLTLTAPGIPMLLQGQEFMQEGAFNDWQMLDWQKTEQFAGIVQAHEHIINLRRNHFNHTAGLRGEGLDIFHHDTENNVIAYRRTAKGGPRDETIIIANLGGSRFKDYAITLPTAGTWRVRFNSTWCGYSTDFHQTRIETVETDDKHAISVPLSERCALILSQD